MAVDLGDESAVALVLASMSSAMKNSPYRSLSTSDCALKTGTRSSWSSTRALRISNSGRYSPRIHRESAVGVWT